jgi:DNA polymerase III delta subunit
MIYLLHGSDLTASRKKLISLKEKYAPESVTTLLAKEIEYSNFPLLFSTVLMFGEKQLVVVEGKLDVKLVDLEKINKAENDLVVWLGEKLRANDGLIGVVNKVGGKVEVFEEKEDARIFPFLDAVVMRNRKLALRELVELLNNGAEPIYLNTMLVWQFRQLIVPELASGFVRKKIDQVKGNFTFEELRRIYYSLLQMDVQLKTGEGVPEALVQQFVWKITK